LGVETNGEGEGQAKDGGVPTINTKTTHSPLSPGGSAQPLDVGSWVRVGEFGEDSVGQRCDIAESPARFGRGQARAELDLKSANGLGPAGRSLCSIGLAACLHLVASTPCCRYAQEFITEPRGGRPPFLKEPFQPDHGYLTVPQKPGLGIEVANRYWNA